MAVAFLRLTPVRGPGRDATMAIELLEAPSENTAVAARGCRTAADQAVRHRDRQCHAGAGGRSDCRAARRRNPHASQLCECRLREHRLPQPGVSGSLAAVGPGVCRRHRRAGGRRRVGPAGSRQRQRHRPLPPLGRGLARHRQADLPAGRPSGRGRGRRALVGQELSRRGVGRLAARLLLGRGRGQGDRRHPPLAAPTWCWWPSALRVRNSGSAATCRSWVRRS